MNKHGPLLLALLALIVPAAWAANDPGHDTLYVLNVGDSNVTGSINVSGNLTSSYVRAATLLYGDQLDIRANGSVFSVSSRPAVQADANHLYLDSISNVYIATKGGTAGVVQIGPVTGSSITLNVSGTIRQQNVAVCLQDGTNCPAALQGATGYTKWRLGSNTGTIADITNNTLVNITAGTGISTTLSGSTITIANTGDTNSGDDLTTSSAHNNASTSDINVSGAYNALNLQIGAGKIGASELATTITLGSGQVLNYGAGTINASLLANQNSGYYLNRTGFAASNITSGVLAVANGGTGSNTAAGARGNLSAAANGTCATGTAVQNATAGGVQCVALPTLAESDTLATVTGRGATTNDNITIDANSDGTTNIAGTLYVNGTTDGVGIGTATPGAKLEVVGDILVNNGAADGGNIYLNSAGYSAWTMDNTNGAQRFYYGTTEQVRFYNNGGVSIGQAYAATTPPTNGTIIQGNVGIGAAGPSAKLEVNGTIKTSNDVGTSLSLGREDNAHEGAQILFNPAASYDGWYLDVYDNNMRAFTGSANTNTFQIMNSGAGTANLNVEGSVTASSFSGAGTGLTGTAASLTAGAASALAADGTNCGAGQYAQGVDTAGNAQGCAAPTASTTNACNGDGTCEVQSIAQSNAASDLMIYTTGGGIYNTRNTAGDIWNVAMGNGGTAVGYVRAQYGGSWNNNAAYLYHDGANGAVATGAGSLVLLPANGATGFGGSPSNGEGWGEVIDVYDVNHARLSVRANTIDARLFAHTTTYGGMTGGGTVGTSSSHPFGIMTANANRMYFDTSGNVGIGTTGPAVKLDLNGSNVAYGGQLRIQAPDYAQISFYSSGAPALGSANREADIYYDVANNNFVIENWNNGAYGGLSLNPLGGNVVIPRINTTNKIKFSNQIGDKQLELWDGYGMGIRSYTMNFHSARYYAWYQADAGQDNGAGAVMLLDAQDKRLGIGTASPGGRLDVASNVAGNGVLDGVVIHQQYDNTNSIQAYIDGQWAARTTYASGCCNALLLQPDVGVVGIRTNAPAFTLDVNGSLHATSIYPGAQNTDYWGWDGAGVTKYGTGYTYISQGTFYVQSTIQARGGISNDAAAYINMGGERLYNVATPTDNTDAATKAYVDTYAYIVAPQANGCTWNSEEGSWSYSYPSDSCPTGWTTQTGWNSLSASGGSGGSCTAWRFTVCRKN